MVELHKRLSQLSAILLGQSKIYKEPPTHPMVPLPGRRDERDDVSNHQRFDCLLNRSFRHRSKKKNQSSATLAFVWGIDR